MVAGVLQVHQLWTPITSTGLQVIAKATDKADLGQMMSIKSKVCARDCNITYQYFVGRISPSCWQVAVVVAVVEVEVVEVTAVVVVVVAATGVVVVAVLVVLVAQIAVVVAVVVVVIVLVLVVVV